MSNNSKTVLAFVLGAAMGGITAILLAPDKGDVTRQRLRDGGARIIHRGRDAVSNAASTVEESARERGHAVGEAVRRQAGAMQEAAQEAKDTYRREMAKP